MASVFRSFLRSGHRFPCRYSNLRARGVFLSPHPALRGDRAGYYKRPDRHRKNLTPPRPMSATSPVPLMRSSGRGKRHKPTPLGSLSSVVQRAQRQGFLRRRRG